MPTEIKVMIFFQVRSEATCKDYIKALSYVHDFQFCTYNDKEALCENFYGSPLVSTLYNTMYQVCVTYLV